MNYLIEIFRDDGQMLESARSGYYSGSNLHTAVRRALTGFDPDQRGIAATGKEKDWIKLGINEALQINVRRV